MSLRDKMIEKVYEKVGFNDVFDMDDAKEFADAILNLPEMVEMKSKASIFDHIELPSESAEQIQEWKEKAEQLGTLMDGLMVKEECHNKFRTRTIDNLLETCEICHDTGYITRPATGEEVREFISRIIPIIERQRQYSDDFSGEIKRSIELDSGATLFMKEEK